ncbi:50S ribosomal protein L21 [Candidatus Woesebacteria bacterium RIFCSPHIGHO2_01_FULL_38_10]|uniref:Large ribosomal subunit protein bL21 n=1 Tax=Candidatus Woesebacteria bacterium RIFCSPLOWO2_01_FULL_39_10b TaxID=1802517 RepID=A0A1F8B885_9BACT|nr:MAG: 50S ribosomal protein L21 [Candidatus Woesebacteria bacterium RIFCSPHIGHO2_01_FULL_38_10]OGM60140.1 MAG: 50S ribosomal protein L21 [Candidatus Woesebacteria bacterium RIFCSPLOWO2_01_FULL_39_10b]
MSKYAVVKIGGSQYKISEGDEILVDKDDKVEPEALLLVADGKVKVGKPKVEKVKISLKLLEAEVKGKKLSVFKYKAKSRYRKKIGFRPIYSRYLVEKISS